MPPAQVPSLYERLGGVYNIATVVDDFINRLAFTGRWTCRFPTSITAWGCGMLTINNPAVNALGPGVPEGISQAVKEVTQDERVKAAVFIGAGRILVGLDANSSLFS